MTTKQLAQIADIRFGADGLVPGIVQDASDGRVLMLAWLNTAAVQATLRTGLATFWSRSRAELWVKGATSGNTQAVREVRLDCDGDTLLIKVDPAGPACHTGRQTCFDDRRLTVFDGADQANGGTA